MINEACVYKLMKDQYVVFLVLYIDDILFIGNNVELYSKEKSWLAKKFQMKDLG